MAYEPYANDDDFYDYLDPDIDGDNIGDSLGMEAYITASRHVDALTFNRIRAMGGIEALTEFQQDIIREVVCRQARFEAENADVIRSVLSGYSINGVSMQFGGSSWNVFTDMGIAMQRDVYALLQQTGLCCRLVG